MAQSLANEIGQSLGVDVKTVEFVPGGERPRWLSESSHPGSGKIEMLGRFTVQHIDRTFVLVGVQDVDHYGVICFLDDYELQVFPPDPKDSMHMESKPDARAALQLVVVLADKFTRGMTQEKFDAWLQGSLQLNNDAGHPLPEPEVSA